MELGRLWRLVFAALDDLDEPHVDVDLAWILAHTKESDIGFARLSNGSLLTKRDRLANNAADCLPKSGAQFHRVPKAARQRVT